jgi:hypothetical protein
MLKSTQTSAHQSLEALQSQSKPIRVYSTLPKAVQPQSIPNNTKAYYVKPMKVYLSLPKPTAVTYHCLPKPIRTKKSTLAYPSLLSKPTKACRGLAKSSKAQQRMPNPTQAFPSLAKSIKAQQSLPKPNKVYIKLLKTNKAYQTKVNHLQAPGHTPKLLTIQKYHREKRSSLFCKRVRTRVKV